MNSENNGSNGWSEYRRAVLDSISRIFDLLKELDTKVNGLTSDMAILNAHKIQDRLVIIEKAVTILQVKSAFWGAVGGSLITIISGVILYAIWGK